MNYCSDEDNRHLPVDLMLCKPQLQEAQLSLTNRALTNRAVLFCKVVEVWQDFLSEYVNKKFMYICYRRLIRHESIHPSIHPCLFLKKVKSEILNIH